MNILSSIYEINTAEELHYVIDSLKERPSELTFDRAVFLLDKWGEALLKKGLGDHPGTNFLKLWLRRGTLESILKREFWPSILQEQWKEIGNSRIMAFPVGLVGHWSASNVDVQSLLSMTSAFLGKNKSIVRISPKLITQVQPILDVLNEFEEGQELVNHFALVSFPHERLDLHEAMASQVDGAMIWGGREAVQSVRSLPFPSWARISIFGPRVSIAAMDSNAWENVEKRREWCKRLVRDLWQFEQQACSSPIVLLIEHDEAKPCNDALDDLQEIVVKENSRHPRVSISSSLTSAIIKKRAEWLFEQEDNERQARFPSSPDWTLLIGHNEKLPEPVGGKVLYINFVNDLASAIQNLDGNIQTLGLGMEDRAKERYISELAAKQGVDRIIKLGRMHVYDSPWDGMNLVGSMTRIVRHTWSATPLKGETNE